MRSLQIGNITVDPPSILGPMAGVTDLPFRLLCKEQGAGLLCMEMISAKAILYKKALDVCQVNNRYADIREDKISSGK